MSDTEENDIIPEQTSDTSSQDEEKSRTAERFEKLTETNKRISEESKAKDEEIKEYKNLIDSLLPENNETDTEVQAPIPQSVENVSQDEADDLYKQMVREDGYVDGQKLFNKIQELDRKAREAAERADRVERQARLREEAEKNRLKSEKMQAVHEKYPQLDPESEEFNEDFFEAVRNDMIGQMMDGLAPGQENPMASAEKWYSKLYSEEDMNKKQKEQLEQSTTTKKQINATRPRSSSMAGYYEKEDEGRLLDQVRAGKKGALAEALRRRGQ